MPAGRNFYWTPKGSVELYKSSTKPDMTNGNPVYSLSGAKYDVYRSNDDGYVLTLTTNASGYASASGLPYGNYYCVESQPPTGFFKDTSRHYFDVSGNAVIRASDVPYDDPVGALLHKADPVDRRHRSRGWNARRSGIHRKILCGLLFFRSSCTRDKPYAHVGYAYGF